MVTQYSLGFHQRLPLHQLVKLGETSSLGGIPKAECALLSFILNYGLILSNNKEPSTKIH